MFRLFLSLICLIGTFMTWGATPRVCGVRVYDAGSQPVAWVSCPVNAPGALAFETSLDDYYIRAGAADGKNAYLVHSADGLMASSFLRLDLESKKVTTIATYDWKTDLAGQLLMLDMAFRPSDGRLFAIAFDMSEATVEDDEINAPFGLYTIDPATGAATLIGRQDHVALMCITFTAEGDLLAIDEYGEMWGMNPANGRLLDVLHTTGLRPSGLQSMTTAADGRIYWAAFQNDGTSKLVAFDIDGDGMVSQTVVGPLAHDAELVALYVDPDPVADDAPAAIPSLKVTPASQGALSATLEWLNPDCLRNGTSLQNVDINIYANGALVTTLPARTCRMNDAWEHKPAAPGVIEYAIAPVWQGVEGQKTFADALFVGTDVPGPVGFAAATQTGNGYDLEITWDAPLEGANGGWFDRRALTYDVTCRNDGRIIATATSECRAIDKGITTGAGYTYTITPTAGGQRGIAAGTAPCFSGPALSLPLTMDLTDEASRNLWTVVNADEDDFFWYVDSNWGGTTEPFFRYYPSEIFSAEVPVDDWLISPPVSLKAGCNYAVVYEVRLTGVLFPVSYDVTLGQGIDPAQHTTVLEHNVDIENDLVWERRAMTFSPTADGDYSIGFHVLTGNPVQLYHVTLNQVQNADLGASTLTGPQAPAVGVASTYTFSVSNYGAEPQSGFQAALIDEEGNALAYKTVTETIEAMQSITVSLDWTPKTAGSFNIYPQATAEGDEETTNDRGEAFKVTVLNAGTWQQSASGTSLSAYAPFYLTYKHSAAHTFYSDSDLGSAPASIEGLRYTFKVMGAQRPATADVTVYLANADSNQPATLPQATFVKVFEGPVTFDPAQGQVSIIFSRPFAYSGQALCVATAHSAEATASVIFDARVDRDQPSMLLYRSDSQPWAWGADWTGTFADRPNTGFYLADPNGIADAVADTEGDSEWFNLQGIRVGRPTTPGIYLERCGSQTRKVVIR